MYNVHGVEAEMSKVLSEKRMNNDLKKNQKYDNKYVDLVYTTRSWNKKS